MNKYWDMTEQERSALTSDQVRSLLDVELMEKGVVKIKPPVLREVPEVNLDTTIYYSVSYMGTYSPDETGYVFRTVEQAQQFIDSKPLQKDQDYTSGSPYYAKPCLEMTIGSTELVTEQDAINAKAKLSEAKVAKEANKTASADYTKAQKVVDDAVSGVWDDWHRCCGLQRAADEVRATFDEYLALCNQDESLAVTFLAKAYPDCRIDEAAEWLDDDSLKVPPEVSDEE